MARNRQANNSNNSQKNERTKRMTRTEKEYYNSNNDSRRGPSSGYSEHYGFNKYKLTDTQKELANKIKSNHIVFVDSPAGTGKSLTVLHTFVQEYISDPTKQIIIIRTPVEAGMDKIGALPNDYSQKIAPHFQSTKHLLEQLLSKGKVETDMDHRIHFKIPNYVLGATFDSALILIDEAQQLPPMILKLLLERIGIDSKVVVAGDSSQMYTDSNSKRNALRDAIPRFFFSDGESRFHGVDLHCFGVQDVMRSEIVKTVITAYTGLE